MSRDVVGQATGETPIKETYLIKAAVKI